MLMSQLIGLNTTVDLMALAIAAIHTTLQYLDNMIDEKRNAVLEARPSWIIEVSTSR